MLTYKNSLPACDEKIENWDGYAPEEFFATFSYQEIDAMMGWMSTDCPFDINEDYFLCIKESSGYEVMRFEVVTNYIRRTLMYMIDQTDTKSANHWYHVWNSIYG